MYKPKPLNLQPSTSFLKCQTRLSVNEIIDLIKLKEVEVDYDFVCSKVQVENVIQLKGKSSHLPKEIVSQARSKSNPFERIGHGVFMNRAAMKLAAMDADFGLTATKGSNQFKFLDICGGPGGFSEYILWRIHSWGESCHGYGITLKMPAEKDEMNWHTEKFRVDIPKDSFSIIYGQDGTGDLYKPENIRDVESLISKETQNGVDLAVADGGFDFSGHEAEQEQLAQKLILCEIITMLSTLRQGGAFVCKFFDMFTEFTVDLVWLLYQLFDEICITKPLSSRPANSERYVICRNLLVSHPTDLIEKLLDITTKIGDKQFQLISRDILDKDEDFIDYVRMRNIKFIVQQTDSLEQFDMFIQNP
ncbi:FtsJ-domain-containing protein [Rhizopus microsporus ATCC 52813]|uniref:Cap-specific mRNA (nucleoside-2'-O-)-methyltransferase 1 n=1 Tax=Rhizopus microsporus ATCC 52813 TaxID=1340429 RepID=A0A2G4T090_RHIZD|nr:FtsJ-domain-containing protein [Rhizopus microsporus ATCC 52813]PHZ14421.1 FtsJ-domain-containing protein [Rhizopus microsporus ATCC 52813]